MSRAGHKAEIGRCLVRKAMRDAPDGGLTLRQLSALTGLGERTVRRRLDEIGGWARQGWAPVRYVRLRSKGA